MRFQFLETLAKLGINASPFILGAQQFSVTA